MFTDETRKSMRVCGAAGLVGDPTPTRYRHRSDEGKDERPMTNAVTDASFEQDVLKAAQPVLVDFWAEWCGPCKALAPHLDELAMTMAGQVDILKLDIDRSPQTPGRYGVRGIPTLMLFKNGQIAETKTGTMPKSQLLPWIRSIVCRPTGRRPSPRPPPD